MYFYCILYVSFKNMGMGVGSKPYLPAIYWRANVGRGKMSPDDVNTPAAASSSSWDNLIVVKVSGPGLARLPGSHDTTSGDSCPKTRGDHDHGFRIKSQAILFWIIWFYCY